MSGNEVILTTCPRDCYDACGIVVIKQNDTISRVRGDPNNTVNKGSLCGKCAIAYNGVLLDPIQRLKTPLKRVGPKGLGQFQPISWNEAMETIADRLKDIIATTGPGAIVNAHYTGTMSRLAYAFPLRFFNRLGAGGLIASASLATMGTVKRQGGLVVLASVIYGVVMLAFAFSTNFQLSLICSFLMGFAAMYWVNYMNTLMQTSVPEEMRGRVMSIYRITRQSLPLGWLLGGVLSTLLGNVVTLVICASMFIGFNLLAYLRSSQLRET